jgi:hypothetical protein
MINLEIGKTYIIAGGSGSYEATVLSRHEVYGVKYTDGRYGEINVNDVRTAVEKRMSKYQVGEIMYVPSTGSYKATIVEIIEYKEPYYKLSRQGFDGLPEWIPESQMIRTKVVPVSEGPPGCADENWHHSFCRCSPQCQQWFKELQAQWGMIKR